MKVISSRKELLILYFSCGIGAFPVFLLFKQQWLLGAGSVCIAFLLLQLTHLFDNLPGLKKRLTFIIFSGIFLAVCSYAENEFRIAFIFLWGIFSIFIIWPIASEVDRNNRRRSEPPPL